MRKSSRRVLVPLFVLALVVPALAARLPSIANQKPKGYVSDFARVLDAATIEALENEIAGIERATAAEIAVVTVESLEGMSVEEYAVRLLQAWGIGKKDKNNGVLVLVAPTERKARIEVGYGLEGTLPDGLCGEIARETMRPHFKRGAYGDGASAAVARIGAILTGGESPAYSFGSSDDVGRYAEKVFRDVGLFRFGLLAFAFLLMWFGFMALFREILSTSKRRTRVGMTGLVAGTGIAILGGPWFLAMVGLAIAFMLSVFFKIGSMMPAGSSRHPWGGFGGGFSGGGGGGSVFSGFGGGFSGGGGASVSW